MKAEARAVRGRGSARHVRSGGGSSLQISFLRKFADQAIRRLVAQIMPGRQNTVGKESLARIVSPLVQTAN